MGEPGSSSAPTRVRAGKACQRCSQRKVKCDGAIHGLPCSRCRSDGVQDCKLNSSRRGCYQRKGRPIPSSSRAKQSLDAASIQNDISEQGAFSDNNFAGTSGDNQEAMPVSYQGLALPVPEPAPPTETPDGLVSPSSLEGDNEFSAIERQAEASGSVVNVNTTTSQSLHAVFEDFLRQQGISDDEVADKLGFVLLSQSSPLSFALQEIQNKRLQSNTAVAPREQTADMVGNVSRQDHHPSHVAPKAISYLQSIGAFDLPEPPILEAFIQAFMTRFYPLYSIVDSDEIQTLYREQKLPWILLNAICLIGATFCDADIIHQSSFKKRSSARRIFYNKSKALFDFGYETNKIILLQSVLMLTFWGPHMKTYWNPSSWIDFATNIAASLGIHRSSSLTQYGSKYQRLLRRVWWTVLARDASCATLLGRPFRIRISQCDTDPLTLDDFTGPSGAVGGQEQHALYQIHNSRLSLILRQVSEWQSNGGLNREKQDDLHTLLQNWHHELPAAIDWARQPDQKNIFANSLKVVYHHHVILLYLESPTQVTSSINYQRHATASLSDVVVSAAQTISSSALSLMVNHSVSSMSPEIFTGFFIAGVVFYRQTQEKDSPLVQLQRSALDNCQMILNEARENCDAAQWMMRVFEFLLSGPNESRGNEILPPELNGAPPLAAARGLEDNADGLSGVVDSRFEFQDPNMLMMDWDYPFQENSGGPANDFFFMPDWYAPAVGITAESQFYSHI
ncbi:hypothetical protein LTR84_005114 [Exophiala bonariae]|uniref:Zn(2)-C6 fungal-type domain-containing protein n=1 Tax=Exophiala bonariae TaxID=1690606 RepID=A0AAV9NPH6_9EURO|nr:hypothetical protein LTR84_005114 [Exophiala bonariae]